MCWNEGGKKDRAGTCKMTWEPQEDFRDILKRVIRLWYCF
jgi:hypothetical protein